VADDVRPITELVNIFDEEAFAQVADSKETDASRADAIAYATAKTITERWDEDPTFYKKFSELIRKVIEDFKAQQISDLEYLRRVKDIRSQVVHRDIAGIPLEVRDDAMARAFFGSVREALNKAGAGADHAIDAISAEAAKHFMEIVGTHRRVDWVGNPDVENAIKNDIDDYVFDAIRGGYGVLLTTEALDELTENILIVARRQAA
jgi:type I restriction enzyme R subunit